MEGQPLTGASLESLVEPARGCGGTPLKVEQLGSFKSAGKWLEWFKVHQNDEKR